MGDWLVNNAHCRSVPLDVLAKHLPDWVAKLSLHNASGSLHELRGKKLKVLILKSSSAVTGSLEDLHCMPLQELRISDTQITGSLEALNSKQMTHLDISDTKVEGSLEMLESMPLELLDVEDTAIS